MCWFNCKFTQFKYKSVSLNVNVKGLNIATNGQPYEALQKRYEIFAKAQEILYR